MKILIIKLSSLGDVLHNLPVVWDIREKYPHAHIAWAVEEAYVHLLEPLKSTREFRGIDQIIPVCLRRCKKILFKGQILQAMADFAKMKKELTSHPWNLIIETQGLIKSAVIANIAKQGIMTSSVYGIGNQTQYSGYEPLARLFYDKSVKVPLQIHAVDRSRAILATGLQLDPPNRQKQPPLFYPAQYINQLRLQPNILGLQAQRYAMCFHATARAAKAWDESSWVVIGNYLLSIGITPVFPWGSADEKEVSMRLIAQIPGAKLPGAFTIAQAATLIAQAKITIGVDTGFTHLSAVFYQPTIELYVDSPRWKTFAYWSHHIINLGDRGKSPKVEEVIVSIDRLLHEKRRNTP